MKISVASLIEDTLSFCRERFKNHEVNLTVHCPAELKVHARPVQLSQVLLNLLNNAHDAVEGLSEKWIKIESAERDGLIEISVTDSGAGIPIQLQEKILQPFFTTKEPNRGTGLGLSVSNSILMSHKGSLSIDSKCANTRFVVALPKESREEK